MDRKQPKIFLLLISSRCRDRVADCVQAPRPPFSLSLAVRGWLGHVQRDLFLCPTPANRINVAQLFPMLPTLGRIVNVISSPAVVAVCMRSNCTRMPSHFRHRFVPFCYMPTVNLLAQTPLRIVEKHLERFQLEIFISSDADGVPLYLRLFHSPIRANDKMMLCKCSWNKSTRRRYRVVRCIYACSWRKL